MLKNTTISKSRTLLPDQAYDQWQPLLASLSPPEQERLRQILAPCLPPLALDALSFCAELVEGKGAAPLPHLPAPSLEAKAGSVGGSHPLYHAFAEYFPSPDSPAQIAARAVLQALFAEPPDETQKPDTYYNDLLAVRDLLRFGVDWGTLVPDAAWDDNLRRTLRTYRSLLASASEELIARGQDKSTRSRRLLDEEREPGVGHNRRSPEKLLPPQRGIRARSNQPWRAKTRQTPATPASGEVEISDGSWHVQPPKPEPEAGPMPDADRIQRSQPSVLTRADDRRQARRGARMAPTDTLVAETDVQRLPPERLAQVLDSLRDRTLPQWAFATLLIGTGMPLGRLSKLKQETADPGGETPYWDVHKGLLRYRLRDAPMEVINEQGRSNRVIELPLPRAINDALSVTGDLRPFRQVPRRTGDGIRQRFQSLPGPNPTLQRIRATAWEWIRPHTLDDIAALALSGEFTISGAAPAAYRQFQPDELATAFQQTWGDLTASLPSSATRADVHAPTAGLRNSDEVGSPGITGSARAREPEEFVKGFQGLQDLTRKQGKAIRRGWVHGFPDPEQLLAAVRLQAAHTYLAWLLGTGARPVGIGTQFVRRSAVWYLSDKGSPIYRERRLIPPIALVNQQLDQQLQDLASTADLLRDAHFSVDTTAPAGSRDLPAILVRKSNTVRRQPLTHKTFNAILREHGFDAMAHWARNSSRHTVATFLRQHLPDWLVHAQLGHVTQGLAPSHPARASRPPDWEATRSALTKLLDRAGFRPTRLDRDLHGN